MRIENDMRLLLYQYIYEKLKICVEKASPNEACGLIFGNIKEIKNPDPKDDYLYNYTCLHFECIKSSRESAVAFLIESSEEVNEIIQNTRLEKNTQLISIFHSHPGSNQPSGVDLDYMRILDSGERIYCGQKINRLLKNQIWTIMNARNFELKGFIYLNNELFQIVVEEVKK